MADANVPLVSPAEHSLVGRDGSANNTDTKASALRREGARFLLFGAQCGAQIPSLITTLKYPHGCDAVPTLVPALFVFACSGIAGACAQWVFRVPLDPGEKTGGYGPIVYNLLTAVLVGSGIWLAAVTFGKAGDRLADGGGEGCRGDVFLSAFVSAVICNAITCVCTGRGFYSGFRDARERREAQGEDAEARV